MVQNLCYVERASKAKEQQMRKRQLWNSGLFFLMLSFQCLRELERITGFETQDGVKSFFGVPIGAFDTMF